MTVPQVIVVGGGAVGLSVAYHLGVRGGCTVTLLERNQLSSGTSWHAAGIVGPLRATVGMTRLANYARSLFPALEKETGLTTGYRQTGGYWLARDAARLDELQRVASVGRTEGLVPQMVLAHELDLPGLDLSAHVGALRVPEDGNVNPVDLCQAYARAATHRGVAIREQTGVRRLLTDGERVQGVELQDGTRLTADAVALCTGAWSRELAAAAGVALPLQAVEHMYVVTEAMPALPNPFPVVRDLDRGIYLKGDAGRLVIGGFEPNAKCWDAAAEGAATPFIELPDDWSQFEPFMHAALALVPGLSEVGIQRFMNGPESFTVDSRPLIGQVNELDHLFVACGMNSVGVMSSAGVGRLLADWILDGEPGVDAWEVDVARVDPLTATPRHMATRMREAVADVFALHWPYKQPTAGRGLRQSALHSRWAAQGAVFGLTGGWERGLWYARSDAERALPYSVSTQAWQGLVEREARLLTKGAALLDLSPFCKLRIEGSGALAGLNRLSTAQLDVALGRTVYTQLLNPHGGIELDITVSRRAEDQFDLTSGAATRWRDMAWLRRQLTGDVQIADHSEDLCIIGVMGAASRDLLRGLIDVWRDNPFGSTVDVTLAGAPCVLTRLSFVGTLGWEVTVSVQHAGMVFDALVAAGAQPFGHYALDACRVEKGFKHWGHELGPAITPLEAGLAGCIDWARDFQGKQALLKQRERGLTRRLHLLRVAGEPLLLHDEPVFEGGALVGMTTSGALGARTGLRLSFALLDVTPGESKEHTASREFEVDVAGVRYPAEVLLEAPYDPRGLEMRA
ncbi:MAG: FAD-dependent oxidoreductase [Pseudomonadota bacterium]